MLARNFFNFCSLKVFKFAFAATAAATKCEELRDQASNGQVGAFIPRCKADGSFEREQCWSSTGYCWCVDKYGVEIPGSKVRGKPDCSNEGKEQGDGGISAVPKTTVNYSDTREHDLLSDNNASFNPLSPGVKLQILLLCFHTFLTEVVGRSC